MAPWHQLLTMMKPSARRKFCEKNRKHFSERAKGFARATARRERRVFREAGEKAREMRYGFSFWGDPFDPVHAAVF